MEPTVKVWDPFVRVFHWALVIGFFVDYFYLEGGHDYLGGLKLHNWLGYLLWALVILRIGWGFVGTKHARFGDFVPTPRKFFEHMKGTLTGKEQRYMGHNPAAGAMAVTLMGLVIALCATGWMQGLDAFWGETWVEELHLLIAQAILGLVVVHVAAAIGVSWMLKENLIAAMVTGYKHAEPHAEGAQPKPERRRGERRRSGTALAGVPGMGEPRRQQ